MLLDMDTPAVRHLCAVDKNMAALIATVGEIEYSTHKDGYSFLVHEIIEQMLSVQVAARIFDRFVELCGGQVTPLTVFRLSLDDIMSIGISKRKAKAIAELTECVIKKPDFLDTVNISSAEIAANKLQALYGIGAWTAKMYLIFVMNQEDILPYEDGAFLQTYKWLYKTKDVRAESIKRRCEPWKPYSSIGARYFYRALDMGLCRKGTEGNVAENNE